MKRRQAMQQTVLTAGALMLGKTSATSTLHRESISPSAVRHSVCRWCFDDVPLEELCSQAVDIGLESIELTGPKEWKVMKEFGLTCAMGWGEYPEGVTLDRFACHPGNHQPLVDYYKALIPTAAEAGVNNIIALSGQRNRRSDQDNMDTAIALFRKILPVAADYGVTISIENLNSKIDHPDHQFDHMEWGVELCDRLDSDYFKILFDIYHAQIMEGDIVRTIRRYSDYISHYHTAGVPGRHEIDETQELNYPFIIKAIKDTGYRGFIGQEFVSTGSTRQDRFADLREAVDRCSV